jgi:hypothetical protein
LVSVGVSWGWLIRGAWQVEGEAARSSQGPLLVAALVLGTAGCWAWETAVVAAAPGAEGGGEPAIDSEDAG